MEGKEGMPIISIVVPVYNAEQFLPRCLESLVSQTYKDLQIICVNDGSRDNSQVILERFAQSDARIQIIQKPNGGVASARNVGIDHARGEFITFLDADDWAEPSLCALALESIQKCGADVACWGYMREKGKVSVPVRLYQDGVWDPDGCRALYKEMFGLTGAQLRHPERMDQHVNIWNKLYRMALIQEYNIRFQNIRQIGSEDLYFNIEYFFHVRKAATLSAVLTHYSKENQNSITTLYHGERPAQWKSLYQHLAAFIDAHGLGIDFHMALRNKIALSIIWLGLDLVRSNLSRGEKVRQLSALLRDEVFGEAMGSFRLKGLTLVWHVFFFCAKMRWTWACYGMFIPMEWLGRGR